MVLENSDGSKRHFGPLTSCIRNLESKVAIVMENKRKPNKEYS